MIYSAFVRARAYMRLLRRLVTLLRSSELTKIGDCIRPLKCDFTFWYGHQAHTRTHVPRQNMPYINVILHALTRTHKAQRAS